MGPETRVGGSLPYAGVAPTLLYADRYDEDIFSALPDFSPLQGAAVMPPQTVNE